MIKVSFSSWIIFLIIFSLFYECKSSSNTKEKGDINMKIHYVEIVSENVKKQCQLLEQLYGLSFSAKIKDLGNAKVAKKEDGTLIGVRAPLADHEKPIIRVYFAVDDIQKAVKIAEEAGAIIAYPPTKQGETGTWAIYILDGIQYGLWQK